MFFTLLFAALFLNFVTLQWSAKNPRQKGEPMTPVRWFYVGLSGFGLLLVVVGFFTIR